MGKHQDLDVEGDIATQLDELKTVVPKFKKVAAEVSKYIKAIAAIQAAETRVQEALSELGRPPPKCPRRVKDMRSAVVKGSECLRKCQQLHWNQVDVLESDLIPAIEAVVQDASKTQSALEKELKEGKAKATQEIKKEEKKLQKLEKKHGKATDDRTDSDVIDQHGVVEDSKTALQDFLDTFYEKVLDEHRARFSKVVGALVNYGGSALNKYMKVRPTVEVNVERERGSKTCG
ncbi:hypothetical protein PTSG_03802 [Salpingoeca rosetta]|uniref:IMD domain-containing protein n=1 Tax=Salpingoeca rosetta (strain ATCC 50818 / BSB-021) TaxID=946362 RepID=F2U5F5_SALR5|nr:uncharacterized protein PTSG_03802 [Salpingoeca rosetta]EGD83171.1 hypothetical protein PTSG_03802 [Salpingoeca rosetta]|eukprot:XP_004995535.1 hypothetical protein PTSG_03802 [Salpingoeca rosetta]